MSLVRVRRLGLPDDPRYVAEVRRRVDRLAGWGSLPTGVGTVTGQAGNREHGAEVEVTLRCEQDSIAAARFRAFGCPHLLAAASWSMERITGIAASAMRALGHGRRSPRVAGSCGQIRALDHAAGCNPRGRQELVGRHPVYGVEFFASPVAEVPADDDFPDSCRRRTRPHVHGQPRHGRRSAARRQADRVLRLRVRRQLRGRGQRQRHRLRRRAASRSSSTPTACATSTARRSTSCARASTRPSSSAIPTSRVNAVAARASMSNPASAL